MNNQRKNMLLCIDIGNSTIGFGLFPDPAKGDRPVIRRVPTHPVGTARKYRKIISGILIEAASGKGLAESHTINAIISSVVPSLNRTMIESLGPVCRGRPLLVSSQLDFGFSFAVKTPEEMGADRVANAVGGYHAVKRPVAVIDFGTATTITVVGKKRDILGGAILPGIGLMQSSLFAGTAKLPLIALNAPASALGKDTVSSIASGILYGTAGAVEILVKRMEKELKVRLQLILTGGHAARISPLIRRRHSVASELVFDGLRLIYLKVKDISK